MASALPSTSSKRRESVSAGTNTNGGNGGDVGNEGLIRRITISRGADKAKEKIEAERLEMEYEAIRQIALLDPWTTYIASDPSFSDDENRQLEIQVDKLVMQSLHDIYVRLDRQKTIQDEQGILSKDANRVRLENRLFVEAKRKVDVEEITQQVKQMMNLGVPDTPTKWANANPNKTNPSSTGSSAAASKRSSVINAVSGDPNGSFRSCSSSSDTSSNGQVPVKTSRFFKAVYRKNAAYDLKRASAMRRTSSSNRRQQFHSSQAVAYSSRSLSLQLDAPSVSVVASSDLNKDSSPVLPVTCSESLDQERQDPEEILSHSDQIPTQHAKTQNQEDEGVDADMESQQQATHFRHRPVPTSAILPLNLSTESRKASQQDEDPMMGMVASPPTLSTDHRRDSTLTGSPISGSPTNEISSPKRVRYLMSKRIDSLPPTLPILEQYPVPKEVLEALERHRHFHVSESSLMSSFDSIPFRISTAWADNNNSKSPLLTHKTASSSSLTTSSPQKSSHSNNTSDLELFFRRAIPLERKPVSFVLPALQVACEKPVEAPTDIFHHREQATVASEEAMMHEVQHLYDQTFEQYRDFRQELHRHFDLQHMVELALKSPLNNAGFYMADDPAGAEFETSVHIPEHLMAYAPKSLARSSASSSSRPASTAPSKSTTPPGTTQPSLNSPANQRGDRGDPRRESMPRSSQAPGSPKQLMAVSSNTGGGGILSIGSGHWKQAKTKISSMGNRRTTMMASFPMSLANVKARVSDLLDTLNRLNDVEMELLDLWNDYCYRKEQEEQEAEEAEADANLLALALAQVPEQQDPSATNKINSSNANKLFGPSPALSSPKINNKSSSSRGKKSNRHNSSVHYRPEESFDPVAMDPALSLRFEAVWKDLHLPARERLDLAVKYARLEHAPLLADAVLLWEIAKALIKEREEMMDFVRTFLAETKRNLSLVFRMAEFVQEMVTLCSHLKDAVTLVYVEVGDFVTFHGEFYLARMQQENEEFRRLTMEVLESRKKPGEPEAPSPERSASLRPAEPVAKSTPP